MSDDAIDRARVDAEQAARLKALQAEAAAPPVVARVHWRLRLGAACGQSWIEPVSSDPLAMTCPHCARVFIASLAPLLSALQHARALITKQEAAR